MAQLKWSTAAAADLEGIFDYIARDSRHYAQHQIEHIIKSAEHLRRFPEFGRRIPEFPHLPHREVIIDSYRLIYRYESDTDVVFVVTVVHGRRLLTEGMLP